MLNKIDKNLFFNVKILNDSKQNCIISLKKEKDVLRFVQEYEINKYTYFNLINSIMTSLSISDMCKIACSENVVAISSVTKVCTMINVAKDIIGVKENNLANSNFSIAVIDTGLYPHLDFMIGKKCKILKFVDFVNDKTNIYDDNGHGTFITSLLSSNGVVSGKKYKGVDTETNIIVIKALDKNGETTALNILKSMQWIYDNSSKYNIKVVCMSFGSNVLEKNDPLIQGAEVLWDKGIVVVCACGNSGPGEATIKSPSASVKVISVGALNDARINEKYTKTKFEVAEFSSRGPILSNYKPDIIVSGVNVKSACNYGLSKKFYDAMSGTSVSAPIVAGVVSKLIKKYPHHTPDQIKKILINNCKIITGDRNAEGFGWLDLHNIFID